MHVLVLGLGVTGWSVVRYAKRQNWSCTVLEWPNIATHEQQLAHTFPDIEYLSDWPSVLDGYDQVIISPGIKLPDPWRQAIIQAQLPLYSDLDLFSRACSGRVIAITGTVGKSTVVTLLTHALKAQGRLAVAGGNLGVPALDLLSEPAEDYVLEVSSYQLEYTQHLRAEVACILNLSPNHLDRHGSFAAYAACKRKIYTYAQHAVYESGNQETAPDPACFVKAQTQFNSVPNWTSIQETRFPSSNIAAVEAILSALKADPQRLSDALVDYSGLAHRCEQVGVYQGITYINDSKGTTCAAAQYALQHAHACGSGSVWWLLGGDDKGVDLSALVSAVTPRMPCIFVYGRSKERLYHYFKEHVPVSVHETLIQALHAAQHMARSGDVILLSPACASWDQFQDYQARGYAFISGVRNNATLQDAKPSYT